MAYQINVQTLSEQIYCVLREEIVTQNIKCGSRLTLESLKERFGVSHTPIREALTRLVEDSLVTHYSNVGITVVSLDENDVREIFELNGDLDCLALSYSMRENKADFLATLEDIITKSVSFLAAGNMKEWSIESDKFHATFYDFCDNSRLKSAAKKLRAQTMLLYNLYHLEGKNAYNIQDYHTKIVEALQADNIKKALKLLRAHLDEDMQLALAALGKLDTDN